MSDAERARQERNFGKQIHKKLLLFGGDCPLINEYLITKSDKSIFGFLQYVNSLLRSFGYVIQANNPVSGLIIILAIGVASYKAMFSALLTSSLAFLFAKLIQQDILGNLNGFFGYNAVLHAVVSVGHVPIVYDSVHLDEPRFWLFLVLATLISVYFTSAFANLMRYLWHYPIPCFTIPFNLLQYVLIFCLLNNSIPPRILSSHLLEPPVRWNHTELAEPLKNESLFVHSNYSEPNASPLRRKLHAQVEKDPEDKLEEDQQWQTTILDSEAEPTPKVDSFLNETHLKWGETFSGTITALSQVFGLNDIPCSVLMFLALVIYSPITAMFCYLGGFVGTLIGIFFSSDYEKVYDGTWGYNGLLSAGALAGFGFVLTAQSAFLAFVAVVFCTVFQHFITPLFETINVPIFHIPFIVTTVIFLLVTAEVDRALPRPGIYTYPEKHRREFKNQDKNHLEGYLYRARGSNEV